MQSTLILDRHPLPSDSARPSWRTTIHGAFDRVAERFPRAIAVEEGGQFRTYEEVAAASMRLAARLAAAGVRPGDVVGVCVGRSPEFVVALLAILRCGAAYAPLPGGYPLPRLLGMVEDALVRVLIVDGVSAPLADSLERGHGGLVRVSIDSGSVWSGELPDAEPTASDVGPESPAYVMFTSGSTGRPRGVVIPHRAVVGLVVGQSFADFGPGLRTLLLAPTAFDASTFELWAPLLHGGTAVVFPDDDVDPVRLGEVLRAGRVNCLWLTAGLFNLVVDLVPSALDGVAHVLTGGDVLSIPHVRRAFAECPGIRLTNGYGPTETTTFACTHAIDPGDEFPEGTIPIGRPLAHTACLVVDERGEPVPDGVEGELLIGGSGVALGYLSGDRTRFVADPRGTESGIWYRSGDRCRRSDDGTLLFLGRVDREVKIRGHRVDPAELEAVLAAHPELSASVAVPFGPAGDRSIGVAVVRRDGGTDSVDGLRDWLAERVPPALLPARIVSVAALPVTPNGKLDRDALVASFASAHGGERPVPGDRPETVRLVEAFNRTDVDLGPPATLQSLVERRVRMDPGAIAVEFEGTTLDYGGLWSRASRLAAELRRHGAGPHVPVAICAERSIDLVVGLLGILAAGAPYLPLDPEQPPSRSARMARVAAARLVLVQGRLLGHVAEFAADAIVLDDPAAPWSVLVPGHSGLHDAELPGAPEDPAYVIFTSGSTGEPKGVINTHAGIVNRLRWMQTAYDIGPSDRILQKTPYGFDVSVWEFFWPLIAGARIVVAPPGAHRDAVAIAGLVSRSGITVIHFVPSMLDAFLEVPGLERACGSLRHVVASGEALSETAARETLRRLPARLHNLYGPTEAAVDATFHEFRATDPPGPVPIGRPIANMRAYVLDAERRPVDVGETGELWLAGVGVALGYAGRPDLTAERFLPDPFRDGTMYRTGDLARWRPDGAIEYLGRTDHQVKLRGVRIELGEIETAIERVEPGSRAVVLAREDRPGDVRLVAYVVGGVDAGPPSLRDRLLPILPAAMVPSRVMRLSEFPVTPNGKLDRAALPRPADGTDAEEPAFDPPRGAVETLVAELWRALLGGGAIGRDDDFFDRGGNSLVAMRLVVRIERATGVRLPVRMVFDRPRLAELAEEVARREEACRSPQASTPPPEGPLDLPALPAQRGMWALHDRLPERATYNQPFAFRLGAAIDPQTLRGAMLALARRHPALRTSLQATPAGPIQRVMPADGAAVDWTVEPGVGPDAIDAALRDHARRPFDLARLPLWRATFFPAAAPHGVILVVFHHAVIDEWSVSLFLDELETLGSGRGALPEAPACRLGPPAPQRAETLRRHWQDTLAGAQPALRLPGARPGEGAGTGGEIRRRSLDGAAVGAARAARAAGCTVAQWLVACFHAWLQRITVAGDVVVLTPVSLRGLGVAEDAFGCCLNTVPVRVRWRDDGNEGRPAEGVTLPDLAAKVRRAMVDATDHADLPFDEIAAIASRGGRQGGALADILVVVTEGARKRGRFGDAGLEPISCDTGTAKFGATFFFDVVGGDVELAVEYATAVHDGDLIEAHLASLSALLRGALRDPGVAIETLPLNDASPLVAAPAVTPALPPIHAAAIGFARTAPDVPAVVAGSETLTYADLDARSRALAARLVELGAVDEERIGICLPRGASSCVTLLGVLRAGAVCVPLDPALPAERLARMVAIAGVRLVVCDGATAGIVAGLGPVEPVPADGHAAAPGFIDPPVAAEALAYVLFTSGSTGDPKGVEMPHGPLAALFEWQTRSTPRGPGDRTLHFASTGFDAAFQEVFSAWAAGCAVVVADEEVRRDPARLVELLSRERVDRAILPTAMLIPLAEAALAAGAVPACLRDVIVAGEPLRITPAVRRLFSALPGCRLWNHYGPTETHVVTTHRLDGPTGEWPDHPPIGVPIDGAEVSIVGPDGSRLPPGCVGEIVLGGGCLARGYASRPDLTAERFPVERGPGAGSRTYRTGDLGWIRPDGAIECLGRNDGQVKISGHRIEPGEVEAALAACPGVRRAAVIVRRDGPSGGARLVAFLEAEPGWPGPKATRARLRATLAEPMIPSVVMPVERFPTNVNGKIDRRALEALPVRLEGDTATVEDADPPRGPVETVVAEEWSRILGVSRVLRDDDFFALGGHSLPAMMLVAAIDGRLGVRIPVRTVFDRPRLADLAEAIAAMRPVAAQEPAGPRPESEAATGADTVPALGAQRGMWVLQHVLPDPATYNQPLALRPVGAIDWDAYRERLASAMHRHPALRAALVAGHDGIAQRHEAPGTLPLPWSVQPDVGPRELEAALAHHARLPFDLSVAPLWRAVLFPRAADHGVLLLVFHHAVVDDWSITALMEEIGGLPRAVSGREPPSPEPSGGDGEYWARTLAGAPAAVAWPRDGGAAAVPSGRGAIHRSAIAPEVIRAWRRVARDADGTLFHSMLAACHVWLQRVGNTRDTVVVTPVAVRDRAGIDSAFGCHLTILPVRLVRKERGATAATVAVALRETFLDGLDHGGLGFDEIVAAVPGSAGHGFQPLANVMFVFRDGVEAGWRFEGTLLESVPVHAGTARYDLTVSVSVRAVDGGADVEMEYSLDVLDEPTVRELADRLSRLVEAVANDPSVDLDTLDLLDQRERTMLLGAFSGAAVDSGPPSTLLGLVESALARDPGAAAIRDGSVTWSRGDLDRRARRWARRLEACGAGPGTRVVVALPRSAEYVACILGVLRIGAAWVPVDASTAPVRAESIVAAAEPVAIVTDGPVGIRTPAGASVIDASVGFPDAWDDGDGCSQAAAAAYVMFTSGSTGKPKGVVVSHASAVAFVRAMQRRHPLSEKDVFLFSTGTTFDISVYEIFGTLSAGAAIEVAPPGIPDPAVIARRIVAADVTVAQFVPSFLDLLVDEPEWRNCRRLRRVVCGGEALSASLVSRFHESCGAELVNGYGPTEATVYATSWTCQREPGSAGTPPIGRPIGDVRVRLLDASGLPAPVGVAAELFLGGVQLAEGYLGRPDLTAERFLPDPYGGAADRLYRTGDVCRWRGDGNLEYLGRLDHQVKIRGQRVELGEVEAEIERIAPGLRAVATLLDDGAGRRRVVAYVVGAPGMDLDAMRASLASSLPAAAMPTSIVRLEAFPLLPNGKLDRAALPALAPDPGESLGAEPPRGRVENVIAGIWSEVLGREQVGRTDGFFEIGGHSLLAMRVMARLERSLGVRVPLRSLFVAPRLADFATIVERALDPGADSAGGEDHPLLQGYESLVPLRPCGEAAPLFLLPGLGGGISHFLPLVGSLGGGIPVYGLISRSLDGSRGGEPTLRESIDRYAAEIDRFAPRGLVNLGAHSHGGWVAYEVARLLAARGRAVGSVIILDTHPGARLPAMGRLWMMPWRIADRLQRQVEWSTALFRGHVPRSVRRILGWMRSTPPEKPDWYRDGAAIKDFREAVARHPTDRYGGRVDLVHASNARVTVLPLWRWLVGRGLRVHDVPIHHHELCDEKHADAVGLLIRGILADVADGTVDEEAVAKVIRRWMRRQTRRKTSAFSGVSEVENGHG